MGQPALKIQDETARDAKKRTGEADAVAKIHCIESVPLGPTALEHSHTPTVGLRKGRVRVESMELGAVGVMINLVEQSQVADKDGKHSFRDSRVFVPFANIRYCVMA